MFWGFSVYFNIRNTLPKSGPFLLLHPVYTGQPGIKPSVPNGILNRALKNFPHSVVVLLKVLNAILGLHYFPSTWKHLRVISILKPEKRTRRSSRLIDPEVCWIRQASCVKRSCLPGFSTKQVGAGFWAIISSGSESNAPRASPPR